MKGILKYLEPVEEIGYKGGWHIKIQTEKPFNNIFKLSDESMEWVKKNNPPKEMEVDFTVFCYCHYDEETNTASHALLARLNNI